MKKSVLLLLSVLFAFTAFASNDRSCPTPTNVTVTVQENCPGYTYKYKAIISWDAVDGADSYNVYCLDGTYLLGSTNACFYIAGSDNQGTLDFQVATLCSSGEMSDLSEPFTAFIGEINECPAPTGFYASVEKNVAGYAFQITYTWDAVEGAESYSLMIAGEEINGLTETSYVYSTNENVLIEAYLSTECAGGPSNQSYIAVDLSDDVVEVTCPAPENLNVVIVEDAPDYPEAKYKVTFSWDPVEEAQDGYKLFVNGQLYRETTETSIVAGLSEAVYGMEVTCGVVAVCDAAAQDISEFTYHTFIVEPTISIEEYETEFNVYPNPANDILFIETTEDVKGVSIYNIVGIPVYSEYNFSDNSVNVTDFAEGVYFISIRTDKGEVVKRFIKK